MHKNITERTIRERVAIGIPPRLARLPMREIVRRTFTPESVINYRLKKLRGKV